MGKWLLSILSLMNDECFRDRLSIISTFFLPFILYVFYFSSIIWMRNDYEFVRWPPGKTFEVTASAHDGPPENESSFVDYLENDFNSAPEYEHLREIVESPVKENQVVPLSILPSALPSVHYTKKMPKLPLKSERIRELLRESDNEVKSELDQKNVYVDPNENTLFERSCDSSDDGDDELSPIIADLKRPQALPMKREGWKWMSKMNACMNKVISHKVAVESENSQRPSSEKIPSSFWLALIGGFVRFDELFPLCLHFSGFILILGYGEAVAAFVSPLLGHSIWVVAWFVIINIYELVRYLNTHDTIIESLCNYFLAGFIHVAFCILTFFFELEGNVHSLYFFWLLDYFLSMPVLSSLIFHLFTFADSGYFSKDRSVILPPRLTSTFSITVVLTFVIYSGIVVQVYFWIDILMAEIMITILVAVIIFSIVFRYWMVVDIATFARLFKGIETAYFSVVTLVFLFALFSSNNPILPLTVALLLVSLYYARTLHSLLSFDYLRYSSPTLFPTFSYSLFNNNVNDDSDSIVGIFLALYLLIIWGYCMSIFIVPISVGIAISSSLSVLGLGLSVYLVSSSCQETLISCDLLSQANLRDCVALAVDDFLQRRKSMLFDGDNGLHTHVVELEPAQKLSVHTCASLWGELKENIDSLDFILNIRATDNQVGDAENGAINAEEALPAAAKHNQSAFSLRDAAAEMLLTGNGPFGFIGLWGFWSLLRLHRGTRKYEPTWLQNYNCAGKLVSSKTLSSSMDTYTASSRISEVDSMIRSCYSEETRLGASFWINLATVIEAALKNKEIVFRKYFYEYRVRLLSDGVHIPSQVFVSDSPYTLNVQLALTWMKSLSHRKVMIFQRHYLQFISRLEQLDELVKNANDAYFRDLLRDGQTKCEKESMFIKELQRRQTAVFTRRLQHYVDRLSEADADLYKQKQQEWIVNDRIIVPLEDKDLYEAFIEAVKLDDDLVVDYCKFELFEALNSDASRLEDGGGRTRQFCDPLFHPTIDQNLSVEWKASVHFNGNASLVIYE